MPRCAQPRVRRSHWGEKWFSGTAMGEGQDGEGLGTPAVEGGPGGAGAGRLEGLGVRGDAGAGLSARGPC